MFYITVKNRVHPKGREGAQNSLQHHFPNTVTLLQSSLPAGMIAAHCTPEFAPTELASAEKLKDMASFNSFIHALFGSYFTHAGAGRCLNRDLFRVFQYCDEWLSRETLCRLSHYSSAVACGLTNFHFLRVCLARIV